jgi:RecA-family ATPase
MITPSVALEYASAEAKTNDSAALDYIDPTTWQGIAVPQRRWLVPGWIPMGEVTSLYGKPGAGKSLLALQLMASSALMRPWLGEQVLPVRSTGIFCEDDEAELHRRLAAIVDMYGCQFADLGAMRLQSRKGAKTNLLMELRKGGLIDTKLLGELGEDAKGHGASLWIYDTAADGFGGNQNDAGHARRFIQRLNGLARYINGAVLLIAHPSKAGMNDGSGSSGSVQWDAAVRSRLYLDFPKKDKDDEDIVDTDARTLTRMKANYAGRGDTIELRWVRGAFIASDAADGTGPDAETVFMMLLDQITAEKQFVSHNNRAGNYAPRVFKNRTGAGGYRIRDFEKAMQALLERREIVIEDYGRPSDERQRLKRWSDEDPY